MTNTIALWLGALVLALLAVDYFVLGWEITIFLGRKFIELTDWIAIWR